MHKNKKGATLLTGILLLLLHQNVFLLTQVHSRKQLHPSCACEPQACQCQHSCDHQHQQKKHTHKHIKLKAVFSCASPLPSKEFPLFSLQSELPTLTKRLAFLFTQTAYYAGRDKTALPSFFMPEPPEKPPQNYIA